MSEQEDAPSKRPMTVTFNIPENHSQTANKPRRSSMNVSNRQLRPLTSMKQTTTAKTADLSHITDHRTTNPGQSFIPPEFMREIQTPIPLRPGTGVLNAEEKTWHTQIFPSENANSREEVENLGDWLNQMLEENQKTAKDPLELATNARHWFTIAYDELCREVSCDCPERAKLLSSIWKRYQALFQRVVQLHQEEKNYLVMCHKERTSKLKAELDATQVKLKQISQQYRDDQERWSNARGREETKFANMRKKLDLQIKNKRSLMLQIKALKEKLEGNELLPEPAPVEEEPAEEVETGALNPHALSDRVHQMRHRIKTHFPEMADVSGILDDIAHMVDQDRAPAKSTRDTFPALFSKLPSNYTGKVRPLEWVMNALTYLYARRLNELSAKRFPFPYSTNRHAFVNLIYEQMLVMFGTPFKATETLFDLIETARGLGNAGNKRCQMFLQFIDAEQPYRDSIYLDFYCFCLGSFAVSNVGNMHLFPDVFTEETTKFAPISGKSACELAKKVLNAISEPEIADKYVAEMKTRCEIDEDSEVGLDDILECLIDIYEREENRMREQMREQFDMDAAQYGGVVAFSQFHTLVQFSARKLDWRMYNDMMRETALRTNSKFISFNELMVSMHQYGMLVPFTFDRVTYDTESRLDDIFGFMKSEYEIHAPMIQALLERTRKEDDSLYKQLNAAKAKFQQVVETKRTGFFTEVAQRELYELIESINQE